MAWGWEKISLMSSQLSAFLGHQVMVNFQAGGADNFEAAVAEHQIINLLDGARGAVFQGKHPHSHRTRSQWH